MSFIFKFSHPGLLYILSHCRFLVSPLISIATFFQVAIAGLHLITGFGTLGSSILMASLDNTKVRDPSISMLADTTTCGRTQLSCALGSLKVNALFI